jgi:hypothetical protein
LHCWEAILVIGEGHQMAADPKEKASGELEQLTSAIRAMASRVNAQFVVDQAKTRIFLAAGEQREKAAAQKTE